MTTARVFSGRRRGVFLDKDGTLVEDVPYNVDPARLCFTPHALEALHLLVQKGHSLIVVSNQPGIARRLFDHTALDRLQAALKSLLLDEGLRLDGFYYCPHAPASDRLRPACACRKPAPGLLRQAAAAHDIDLARSWMVGDILDDVEAGRRAGCRTILLDVGHETEWEMSPLRTPHYRCADLLSAAKTIVASDSNGARPFMGSNDASIDDRL